MYKTDHKQLLPLTAFFGRTEHDWVLSIVTSSIPMFPLSPLLQVTFIRIYNKKVI